MNCRKCGNAIAAGLKFCTKCGSPVEAAPPSHPASSEPPAAPSAPDSPSPVAACSKCGAALKPGLRFCTACGAVVDVAKGIQDSPSDKTSEVKVFSTPAPMTAEGAPAAKTVSRGGEKKPDPSEKPSLEKQINTGPRCPECGAAIMPTSRTCFACGAKVGQSKPPASAAPPAAASGAPDTTTGTAKPATTDKLPDAVPKVEPPLSQGVPPPAAEPEIPSVGKFASDDATALTDKALPQAGTAETKKQVVDESETPPPKQQTTESPAADHNSKASEEPAIEEESRREMEKPPPLPGGAAVTPPASESGVCLRCGARLTPGEKFCTRCGAIISVPTEEAEETESALAAGAPPEVARETPDQAPIEEVVSAGAASFDDEPATLPEAEPEPVPAATTLQECSRCGAELNPGLRFCTGCGAPVTPQVEESPAVSPAVTMEQASGADEVAVGQDSAEASTGAAPTQEEVVIENLPVSTAATGPAAADACPKCGTPTSAGVRFCIGCGAPVEWWNKGTSTANASSSPAPIQRKGISAGVLVAIFLFLLVVLAGCAFWFWRTMAFSPSEDVAVTQISEAGGAETVDSAEHGSELFAEDSGQPVGQNGGGSETAAPQDFPAAEPSSAAGRTSGSTGDRAAPPSAASLKSAPSSPPASRNSTSPPTSAAKAVQTAQKTAPEPRSSVPFVDDPPPSSAQQPAATPSGTAPTSPPPTKAIAQPAPVPVRPAEPAAPAEGIIFWSGRLQRNKRFIISTKGTDYGYADGAMLPGTPVEIRVLSPAVRVVEAPGPNNSWQRVVLECTRNTNQSVTINVQWFSAR